MESLRITMSDRLTEDKTNYFDVVTEIAVMLRLVTIPELMEQYHASMNTAGKYRNGKRAKAQVERALLSFIMERATPTWAGEWMADPVYLGWQRVDALAHTISTMGAGSPARNVLIRRLSEVYRELRIECA